MREEIEIDRVTMAQTQRDGRAAVKDETQIPHRRQFHPKRHLRRGKDREAWMKFLHAKRRTGMAGMAPDAAIPRRRCQKCQDRGENHPGSAWRITSAKASGPAAFSSERTSAKVPRSMTCAMTRRGRRAASSGVCHQIYLAAQSWIASFIP